MYRRLRNNKTSTRLNMEKLTNIKQLQPGTPFTIVQNGEITNYEFLCIHPHNSKYILAIESLSQEGKKLFIDNLLGKTISHPKVYVGKFDLLLMNKLRLEYHKEEVEYWTKRVQEEELKMLHNG